MIEWFSSWAQGIVVAVIIATIIEMILPSGSSKKYVKVFIGIYILFTIIAPVINKLSSNININEMLDTKEYEEILAKSDSDISKKIEDNNNRTIKDIYTSNLETDIKSKLKEKGYGVSSTYISVKDDEIYTIEKISLDLYKNTANKENSKEISNTITIEPINIQVNGNNEKIANEENVIENKQNSGISETEKQEIQEYLSTTYDIDAKNIEIS